MKTFQLIMLTALSAFLLFAGVPTCATPQGSLLDSLTATGLTVVAVETVDGEEPMCEYMGVEDGTTRQLYYLAGNVLYKKQASQPDSVFYLFTDHLDLFTDHLVVSRSAGFAIQQP